MDAPYGSSCQESYVSREGRGPPAYANEPPSPIGEGQGSESGGGLVDSTSATAGDDLPVYTNTTLLPPEHGNNEPLLSSFEEKARLRRLERQNQSTASDTSMTQTVSNKDGSQGQASDKAEDAGKGKRPERKKSTVGNRWLADAASGYMKKQER